MQQDRIIRMGLAGLGLAHELNGPLTSTALALELLAERLRIQPLPPADVAAELDRILAGVRRMSALVRHLRALARGEQLGVGPVALDDLVDGALRLARPAVQDLGDRVLVRGPRAADAVVQADALLLEQALFCVIFNGVEAATRQVEVLVEPDAVVVRDDGPGFAAPAETGQTSKATGMGVGLSLARLIVEQAGGRLEVQVGAGGGRVRLAFAGRSPQG